MYESISGGILAGGLGRRMSGQDKGLVVVNGKPLLQYPLEALQLVFSEIFISANRNVQEYRKFGVPVVTDNELNFSGPLAGMLRLMQSSSMDYILIVPCDTPLIRKEHLRKMVLPILNSDFEIIVADDGMRLNPVFLVLKTALKEDLEIYLASGQRKAEIWVKRHHYLSINFSEYPDIFFNANNPQDIIHLSDLLKKQ